MGLGGPEWRPTWSGGRTYARTGPGLNAGVPLTPLEGSAVHPGWGRRAGGGSTGGRIGLISSHRADGAGRGRRLCASEPLAPVPVSPPKKPAVVAYEPGTGASEVNLTASISARVTDGTVAEVALRMSTTRPSTAPSPDRTLDRFQAAGVRADLHLVGQRDRRRRGHGRAEGWVSTLQPAWRLRRSTSATARRSGTRRPSRSSSIALSRTVPRRARCGADLRAGRGRGAWLPDQDGGSRVHYCTKEHLAGEHPGQCHRQALRRRLRRRTTAGPMCPAAPRDRPCADRQGGREQPRGRCCATGRGRALPGELRPQPATPSNTRSGIHVVTEKFSDKRMTSDRTATTSTCSTSE